MLIQTRASRIGRVRARSTAARIAALLLVGSWAGTVQGAPKTDVLLFVNGDRLTGEFKGLDRGKLQFKTDATDTISVEWDKVLSLRTDQLLQIELSNGSRYLGQTRASQTAGSVQVVAKGAASGQEFRRDEIVRADVIDEGKLIDRLDGYVTAGYNYTKASELQQFTFTGGLKTRNEKRELSLDGSMTATTQTDVEDSNRYNLTAGYRRLLANRRFYQGFGMLEGNDELGLDLRTTLGGAYGTYLAQTNRHEWATFGGLAVTREEFEASDQRESIEGVVGTSYSFFRFEHPEASVDASLLVLPSLTESGRVRSEASLKSRYEIIKDLFFEISLYGSYDSKPDEEADSDSDYGVTTSLGYSF